MATLRIAFLDVGHGDFAYAETPHGHRLVFDVGTGDVVPSAFLSQVTTISELQISHPHADHFDDIVAMSRKTIRSFRCPSLSTFSDSVMGLQAGDKEKIAALRALKNTIPADNEAVRVGAGFDHTVWFPEAVDANDPNTASLVTTLKYGGVTVLLGGDLPAAGWEGLLKKEAFIDAVRATTIFKAPHHGRKEGCCQALFDVAGFAPALCIISDKPVDKSNENTVATGWYSERSAGCNVAGYEGPRKVLSTRSDGSIFVSINLEGRWWVYPNTRWKSD